MKIFFNLVLVLFSCFSLSAQPWIKGFDSKNTSGDIIETENGDLVFVTDTDVYRIDKEGEEIWSTNLSSVESNIVMSRVIQSSNNDFIVVVASSVMTEQGKKQGMRLAKLDHDGRIIWAKDYLLDSPFIITNLIEDLDGSILLTIFGEHIKFNKKGEVQSRKDYNHFEFEGNTLRTPIHGIIQIENGDLLIMGSVNKDNSPSAVDIVLMKIASTGTLRWVQFYEVPGYTITIGDFIKTEDEGLALLVEYKEEIRTVYEYGFHLIKVDSLGNALWESRLLSGRLPIYDKAIYQRKNGYDIRISHNEDIIIQLDKNGQKINNIERPDNMFFTSLIPCLDGGHALMGNVFGSPDKPPNVLIAKIDTQGIFFTKNITGNIFKDDDDSCVREESREKGFKNWIVSIYDTENNFTLYTTSDTSGNFEQPINEGHYSITAQTPSPVWEACLESNPQEITVDSLDTLAINFPIQKIYDCPLLTVDVSTPFLRRCYESIYYVQYCNKGSADADNAYIDILLDEYLSVISTSIDYKLVDNALRFEVGTVPVNDCGKFSITVLLDCEGTETGQTHCIESKIYPDSICFPTNPLWDMSNIAAEGVCEGDSVKFRLINEGVGDMTSPQPFIVIADEVIMRQGSYQLNSLETREISIPTISQNNIASTYRIEATQSPGNPLLDKAVASVQECNGFRPTIGYENWYAQNDRANFIDIDCRQSIGSFDPNDKQAFPQGYGDTHQLEPETEIEFLVRFQNTGTDTAFRVVIRDSLSRFLDMTSLEMGVSSHPYDWKIVGQDILKVSFPNIELPDSTINEAASHGFFKYKIKLKSTVPLGTRIETKAAIYFDYNEPVITNTVFHTIDTNFIQILRTVAIADITSIAPLDFSPNPLHKSSTVRLPSSYKQLELLVYDVAGKLVSTTNGSGNELVFDKKQLSSGLYFYNLRGDQQLLGAGKILIQD